jgi:DNA-binding NtrC family response regulator
MAERSIEILLVENDAELSDMIARQLHAALGANVTAVATVGDALREELTTQHDVVIASLRLADEDGLSLAREIRVDNACPIILLADRIDVEEALEAMRIGVIDVFRKPFELADLTELVKKAAYRELARRRTEARSRRLRRVASRIIRQRQDVNERMELLCRDFVQAYRRLAEKVVGTVEDN